MSASTRRFGTADTPNPDEWDDPIEGDAPGRWDGFELAARVALLLVFAALAGFFLGQGQWDVAWRFGVLWVLVLIANTLFRIHEAVERAA